MLYLCVFYSDPHILPNGLVDLTRNSPPVPQPILMHVNVDLMWEHVSFLLPGHFLLVYYSLRQLPGYLRG